MLYELIMFGGVIFWGLSIMISLFIFVCLEKESDEGVGWLFPISLGLFYLFSNPPAIKWQWIVSYFVIGLFWFLFMFHYKLGKLKRYLKENPEYIHEGRVRSIHLDSYYRYIYNSEPSLGKFTDRILVWPLGMIKFALGDLVQYIYDGIKDYLISYKKKFLGIVDE